jgi:hypothetical protein
MRSNTIVHRPISIVGIVLLTSSAAATSVPAADRAPWETYSRQPDEWYRGPEGARVAAKVLSFQTKRTTFDTLSVPKPLSPTRLTKIASIGPVGLGDPSLGEGSDLVCGRLADSNVVADGEAGATELGLLPLPSR